MSEEMEILVKILHDQYGLTMTRTEVAEVTKKSIGWVDARMKSGGKDLPKFKRDGGRSIIFPTINVAKWLLESQAK